MNFKTATDREIQVVMQDNMASAWDILAANEEFRRRKSQKWGRVQYKVKEVPAR